MGFRLDCCGKLVYFYAVVFGWAEDIGKWVECNFEGMRFKSSCFCQIGVPLPAGVLDVSERLLDGEAGLGGAHEVGAVLVPDVPFLEGGFVGAAVWPLVADEHDEVAFDAEVGLGVGHAVAAESGGSVLLVEGDEVGDVRDVCVLLAVAPEGGVGGAVCLVMEGEEVADFDPGGMGELVVEIAHSGSRIEFGMDEEIDEGLGLRADDHECGGFEWFDEAAGVADGDDVIDPHAAAATGGELDDAGLLRGLGVFG